MAQPIPYVEGHADASNADMTHPVIHPAATSAGNGTFTVGRTREGSLSDMVKAGSWTCPMWLDMVPGVPYAFARADATPETTSSQMGWAADVRVAYAYDFPNPVVEHLVE